MNLLSQRLFTYTNECNMTHDDVIIRYVVKC